MLSSNTVSTPEKQHHQQINHQVHFLSRIPLLFMYVSMQTDSVFTPAGKVNTPNTAKLKPSIKGCGCPFIFTSLFHNHIIPLPAAGKSSGTVKSSLTSIKAV